MGEMKERMLRGELYIADDPELEADAARCVELLTAFNATGARDDDDRRRLLAELLGGIGPDAVIRPPLQMDYGYRTTIGARTFINVNAVILDVGEVRIGEDCQIGPERPAPDPHPSARPGAAPEPMGGRQADHDRGQRLAGRRRHRPARRDHRPRRRRGCGRGGDEGRPAAHRGRRQPGTRHPHPGLISEKETSPMANLRITRLGHGGVLYRSPNDAWVWVDRWSGAPNYAEAYRTPEKVSVVAPTHCHFDHVGDDLADVRELAAVKAPPSSAATR